MSIRNCSTIVALFASLCLASVAGAQSIAPTREILPLQGDLFQVRSGDERAVFLVTPAGIVLVDPISVETAQWLKAEFEQRFAPGVVRYVVYTSHRPERASGGVIFNDRAEIVGHREFADAVRRGRQRDEVRYRTVRDTESSFDARRTLTLGSARVDLVHAPTASVPEGAVVLFPAQRIGFAADAPLLDGPGFAFGPYKPREVRRWLRIVSSLDLDVLLLGNGRTITRADLRKLSAYVDSLVTTVAAEYEAGRTADEFAEAKLPATTRSDPAFRDWRANVSDTYRDVSLFSIDATIGAMGSYSHRDDEVFCASFATCSTGGVVPGGMAGLSGSFRRWSVLAEVTAIEEVFSSRTSRFLDEDFALRETRVAMMVRRDLPAGAVSLRMMGGLSYSVADRKGMNRVKEGLAPFAGRHPLSSREVRWGYTGGVDVAVGRRLGIVLPIRINYASRAATETWPTRMDAQAGVLLTMRLFRTID